MTAIDQRGQVIIGSQYNADEITIGISFEQYRADLEKKQQRIEELLISTTTRETEKKRYEELLNDLKLERKNERIYYEEHIKDLRRQIAGLDKLSGQVPDNIIAKAKKALASNSHDEANQLFAQVEEQAGAHIAAAAEAAYQLGEIALNNNKKQDAFSHFKRSTRLAPSMPLYWYGAAKSANEIGKFDKSIKYYKQSLKLYKQEGFTRKDSEIVALNNGIGLALYNKEEYTKALRYFKYALRIESKHRCETTYNAIQIQENINRTNDQICKMHMINILIAKK